MKFRMLFVLAASGLLAVTATGTSAAALWLSCDAYNNNDTSMWVRFIDSGERQTFDIVLKMPATDGNLAEARRSVVIGGQSVGLVTLAPNDEGRLSGSLSYDSYASNDVANPGGAAFPSGWTGAVSGNLVRAAGLSCELKD